MGCAHAAADAASAHDALCARCARLNRPSNLRSPFDQLLVRPDVTALTPWLPPIAAAAVAAVLTCKLPPTEAPRGLPLRVAAG